MTKNGPCSPETDMLVGANRQKRRDDKPDNMRRAQDDDLAQDVRAGDSWACQGPRGTGRGKGWSGYGASRLATQEGIRGPSWAAV